MKEKQNHAKYQTTLFKTAMQESEIQEHSPNDKNINHDCSVCSKDNNNHTITHDARKDVTISTLKSRKVEFTAIFIIGFKESSLKISKFS